MKGFPHNTDTQSQTDSVSPIPSALTQSKLSYLSPSEAPFQMDLTNTRSRLPPPPPLSPSSSPPSSPSCCSPSLRSGLGHFSASQRCTCGRGREGGTPKEGRGKGDGLVSVLERDFASLFLFQGRVETRSRVDRQVEKQWRQKAGRLTPNFFLSLSCIIEQDRLESDREPKWGRSRPSAVLPI